MRTRLECMQAQAWALIYWHLGLWLTGYTINPPTWAPWMASTGNTFLLLWGFPLAVIATLTVVRYSNNDRVQ